jgi:PAS domain S-box-containing protein
MRYSNARTRPPFMTTSLPQNREDDPTQDSRPGNANATETQLLGRIKELEARQRHLECLLDSARDAVVEMNADGIITNWNASAGHMLGWLAEEAVGQRMCDLIVPHQHRAAHTAGLERYLKTGQAATINRLIEIEALHRDGSLLAIELSIFTIVVDEKTSFGAFIRDISGRQKAEQALRRSEERYRAVIEHVDEGMIVIKDERVVYANARAAQIAGISLVEIQQIGFLHRIHPDDHKLVLERQRSRLAGEDVPSRYELRLLMPDGSVRWVSISVSVVPWEGGQAILTFFTDATQRKKLEEKLRDSLDERETILENSLAGIAFLTDQGTFRWANQAMGKMFGALPGTLPPADWSVLFPSHEDYLKASGEIAERLSEGRAYQGDLQMRRMDGSLIWVTASGKAVNVLDKAQGSVWALMDITPRKELEAALARASSEREAIFNSALVGISYNVNRRIQWVNDKYQEMSGYSRHELVGKSTRLLYADDESFEADGIKTKAALLRDSVYVDERQFIQRNGEPIWVQLSGRCVTAHKPEAGVIWTLLDINQRRRAEDNIREALKRERELNDLRSRFVSMTSHEFRTPLSAILSAAELLRDYSDRMPDGEKVELLESIGAGVQRMARMLDRVLLIGQVNAHMLEFRPEPTDLLALCHALADEARALPSSACCEVMTEFAPQASFGPYDAKLLRHIFGNLLSNAIKYSPQGGTVVFRVSSQDGKTVFEIEDHGIGIPPAELPHLFESFHRASNVGDIPGTGLGLAIVKNAVELHGGNIEVKNKPERGTCFKVTL